MFFLFLYFIYFCGLSGVIICIFITLSAFSLHSSSFINICPDLYNFCLHIDQWSGKSVTYKLTLHAISEEDTPTIRCPDCDMMFFSRSTLRGHRAVHRGETSCPVCGKMYMSKGAMKKHLLTAHGSQTGASAGIGSRFFASWGMTALLFDHVYCIMSSQYHLIERKFMCFVFYCSVQWVLHCRKEAIQLPTVYFSIIFHERWA